MPDDAGICVYVVDDDASVRNSLKMLFLSAGMKAITFESAEAFLASDIQENNAEQVIPHVKKCLFYRKEYHK